MDSIVSKIPMMSIQDINKLRFNTISPKLEDGL